MRKLTFNCTRYRRIGKHDGTILDINRDAIEQYLLREQRAISEEINIRSSKNVFSK